MSANAADAYYRSERVTLYRGDALEVGKTLPTSSIDCIVTSPPYFGLRDYGMSEQLGMEETPEAYLKNMRTVFGELRRVLSSDGVLWLNLADTYSIPRGGGFNPTAPSNVARRNGGDGSKFMGTNEHERQIGYKDRPKVDYGVPPRNMLGMPWRVALALQDDGWILRNAIIWHKPNAMPENVTNRFSKRYEHIFLFSRSRKYWFDPKAIREPNRQGNPGDVWTMVTRPFSAAHFSVYPIDLPLRCISAGCKPGGTVLDPFSGSGTTGRAALDLGRRYIGIDLSSEFLEMSLTHPDRRLGS